MATSAIAVIMAGGQSSRMRATAGPAHKALSEVLGIPLIEWNLRALLAHGFRRLVVVVADGEAELRAYAAGRAVELAKAEGAHLDVFVERYPLGNVGAIGPIRRRFDGSPDFLVSFVDNLTALDLAAFTEYHQQSGAALSIATHLQEVRMPFGVLHVRDGVALDYVEKPARRFRIASGVYCVSSQACEQIADGARMEVAQLFALLHERREPIAAYHHDRPWIDVNDAAALAQAEQLVRAHPSEFAVR